MEKKNRALLCLVGLDPDDWFEWQEDDSCFAYIQNKKSGELQVIDKKEKTLLSRQAKES